MTLAEDRRIAAVMGIDTQAIERGRVQTSFFVINPDDSYRKKVELLREVP